MFFQCEGLSFVSLKETTTTATPQETTRRGAPGVVGLFDIDPKRPTLKRVELLAELKEQNRIKVNNNHYEH